MPTILDTNIPSWKWRNNTHNYAEGSPITDVFL